LFFEQERATEDISEELHAGNQKVENFAVIGDWQGNGGVYFLIVTGTDSCERKMFANPRRSEPVGPRDKVACIYFIEDSGAADRKTDAVENYGELASSLVEQCGGQWLKLKTIGCPYTLINPCGVRKRGYWGLLVVHGGEVGTSNNSVSQVNTGSAKCHRSCRIPNGQDSVGDA
jgi:hypothetical protein